MKIKIEKGIPMPDPRKKYEMPDLEVGDSVFLEVGTTQSPEVLSIAGRAKRKGWSTMSRSVEGGVRIWRTK